MALKRRRRKLEATVWLLIASASLALVSAWQQQPAETNWNNNNNNQNNNQNQKHAHKASSSQAGEFQAHSTSHFCSMVPEELSRQLKLCKLIRHSAPASEAVSHGASKGLAECRAQFSRDRWNCTHLHGEGNLLVSELAQSVGNRESAFVQAIAAAGIVHSIATACSAGSLSDCACDKSRVGPIKRQDEIWKWGGCSNNIRHGMLFAKHLVELLDAVHQHHQQQQHHHHQQHHHQLARSRRSPPASGRQLRAGRPQLPEATTTSQEEPLLSALFCRQNHSISQTTHKQLIKSMLAERSLERHQEIRMAVNMHNNKIGRTAVAKNMELRCRCHGLSGSCSLKTCWLTLPNFQVIGNYLKGKYEGSVHIPSALNLNKLIPLMDRAELAAILSNKWQQQQQQQSVPPTIDPPAGATAPSELSSEHVPDEIGQQQSGLQSSQDARAPAPEFAALVQGPGPARTASNQPGVGARPAPTPPPSYSYYRQLSAAHNNRSFATASGELEPPVDIPANTGPMTQQQYQALLRDMKLCSNATGQPTWSARELSHEEQPGSVRQLHRKQQHYQHHKHQQQHELQGHQLKQANQLLSQLLHPHDKDALLHLHRSPAYCEPDQRRGFAGISSRLCSRDRNAPDSCDKLCCGRGSRTLTYKESYKCDCKFQYCCSINCSVCEQTMQVAVCN